MKGYKGFKKDFTCNGFVYAEGQSYKHDGEIELCKKGFHFCENPFDVLSYYPPDSVFAEVEAEGKIEKKEGGDTKIVTNQIKIIKKLAWIDFLKAGFDYIRCLVKESSQTTATTDYSAHASTTGNSAHAFTAGNSAHASTAGDFAHASTTGYSAYASTARDFAHASTAGNSAHAFTAGNSAHASTAGDFAHASTAGDFAHASTAGDFAHASTAGAESIACAIGKGNQAKGAKGNWLVLSEWEIKNNAYHIKSVKTVKVDGKKIKANVFYKLENGKFKEVK